MPEYGAGQAMSVPWAMQMKATSIEEPERQVDTYQMQIVTYLSALIREVRSLQRLSLCLKVSTFLQVLFCVLLIP